MKLANLDHSSWRGQTAVRLLNELALIRLQEGRCPLVLDLEFRLRKEKEFFASSLTVLQILGLAFVTSDSRVDLAVEFDQAAGLDAVLTWAAARAIENDELRDLTIELARLIRIDESGQGLTINTKHWPWDKRNFKSLFEGLGIFIRKSLLAYDLKVNPQFATVFYSAADNLNKKSPARQFSPEKLERRLQQQRQNGLEAEKFVMAIERARLAGHPFIDKIEHIALKDVSAGFDIVSFESHSSFILNRFIEVKSFDHLCHFYWSRREIQCAQDHGTSYYLYLVDRSRVGENDYSPIVICDPYSYFISHLPNEWSQSVEVVHFASANSDYKDTLSEISLDLLSELM